MGNYDQILEQARAWGEKRRPDASSAHHAAFANSVAYAMTGRSGGYGGPSLREHYCSALAHSDGRRPGDITFDDAVSLCEDACYGEVTLDMARVLHVTDSEHCFDNPKDDMKRAEELLREAQEWPPESWD